MRNVVQIDPLSCEEAIDYFCHQLSEKEKNQFLIEKETVSDEQSEKIERLEERIRLLWHRLYSARSEKLNQMDDDSGQLSLFDEETAPIPEEPEPETTTTDVKAPQRKQGGWPSPAHCLINKKENENYAKCTRDAARRKH